MPLVVQTPPDTRSLYKTAAGQAALDAWYTARLAELQVERLWLPTRFGITHLLAAGPANAPAVLLLTTWGGSAPLWAAQLPALAAHYRVYALDIPGHTGYSAPVQLSPLNSDYANWLGDLLVALGITRAALVGTSYGSWLALRAAAALGPRVTRVALLSPPFFAPTGMALIGEAAKIAFNPLLSIDAKAHHFALAVLTPAGLPLTPLLAPVAEWFVLFAKHARQLSPKPAPPGLYLLQPPADELRRLKQPSLVLIGQHEVLYDPQAALANARRYLPQLVAAELVPHAGHALSHNQPDMVNQRLLRFLAG